MCALCEQLTPTERRILEAGGVEAVQVMVRVVQEANPAERLGFFDHLRAFGAQEQRLDDSTVVLSYGGASFVLDVTSGDLTDEFDLQVVRRANTARGN